MGTLSVTSLLGVAGGAWCSWARRPAQEAEAPWGRTAVTQSPRHVKETDTVSTSLWMPVFEKLGL